MLKLLSPLTLPKLLNLYVCSSIQFIYTWYYYYLILLLSPNPDFVILLNGDAEIIYKRKEELSVNDIRKYIKYYQEYLNNKQINYCMIDTVENDIENTLRIAKSELDTRLS